MPLPAALRRAAACAAALLPLTAHAGGPVITSVTFNGSNTALVLNITGSGFGPAPLRVPCQECASPFLTIGGRIGCTNTYNIDSWTDGQIVLSGLQANQSAPILVAVTNPRTKLTALQTANTDNTIGTISPGVDTVTFNGHGRNLQMVITGAGFGSTPPGIPGPGNLPFFQFTDQPLSTTHWNAGYTGCGDTDAVGLRYRFWSNTRIIIGGFTSRYGTGPASGNFWEVAPGDTVLLLIANSATNGLKLGYSVNPPTYNPVTGLLGTGAVWAGQLP
jgi:hypothetical protein